MSSGRGLLISYFVVVGVVFGVNLLPAFGPPTWALLVFFRLHTHINPVVLVIVGALAAASGRFVLADASRRLRGHLPKKYVERLQTLGAALKKRQASGIAALGLFALSPLPSAQLFVAAGLLDVHLVAATATFFVGRLISYSIYVSVASVAQKQLGDFLHQALGSPWAIALQVLFLGALVVLPLIDWKRIWPHHAPKGAT